MTSVKAMQSEEEKKAERAPSIRISVENDDEMHGRTSAKPRREEQLRVVSLLVDLFGTVCLDTARTASSVSGVFEGTHAAYSLIRRQHAKLR
jgi:hypothetical protein